MCRIWRPPRNSIFVRSKLLLQVISLRLIFTLRIDVYALRDLMGHCYVHFAFLFTLTIHANKPHYYIRLNKQTKDDLLMWISFLHTYNGKTLIYSPTIADSSTVHFYSDASKSAFGATYGSYWIQGKWPTDWQREDITVLELYPIFLAINIFKLKLTNAHIVRAGKST